MSKKPTETHAPAKKQAVSTKVHDALDAARDKASGAAGLLESNPLAALLGGIALGAAAGALIPRSNREKALLAPLGERLADAVRAALAAGREAGTQALDESGLSADGLRDQVSALFQQATSAAGAAGTAAFAAAREKATG